MFAHAYVTSTPTNVATGPHTIHAVILSGGRAASTAIIYDDDDGTSDAVLKLLCAANTCVVAPGLDIAVKTGIRVALTGTGAACTVVYR